MPSPWAPPAPGGVSYRGRFIGEGKETGTAGGSLGVRFAHAGRGLRALVAAPPRLWEQGQHPLLFFPGVL